MREKFQIFVAKLDSGKQKLATKRSNHILLLWEYAEEIKILQFELNGCETENAAMETMFSPCIMCGQYIGGCSVHWEMFSTSGVFSTSGRYHEYIGGIS